MNPRIVIDIEYPQTLQKFNEVLMVITAAWPDAVIHYHPEFLPDGTKNDLALCLGGATEIVVKSDQ